jgi:hypothetical protein
MSESDMGITKWGKMGELEKGEGLHFREEATILVVPIGRDGGSKTYYYKVLSRIERCLKTPADLISRSWLFYFC